MGHKSQTYSLNGLTKCYRPPRLAECYPGNKVMLASGGPCMTVTEQVGDIVHVMWTNRVSPIRCVTIREKFNINTLTCYGAK